MIDANDEPLDAILKGLVEIAYDDGELAKFCRLGLFQRRKVMREIRRLSIGAVRTGARPREEVIDVVYASMKDDPKYGSIIAMIGAAALLAAIQWAVPKILDWWWNR